MRPHSHRRAARSPLDLVGPLAPASAPPSGPKTSSEQAASGLVPLRERGGVFLCHLPKYPARQP